MASVGIEAMNIFGGSSVVDVTALAQHRGLDPARFDNLLISEKAVALPMEDPITYAVNAAKPLLDALTDAEKDRIELLIVCSESGIDFGKSMSTYVHKHLNLNRNCRLFEIKQACYSGTAGLQTAMQFVLSNTSPGAKALVISSDISRYALEEGEDITEMDWAYAEPSAGAGATALLVSDQPKVFSLDIGANGYYGYEVMDTCRPIPDSEAGDPDLSLLSYLDCLEQTVNEYQRRVPDSDFRQSFQYLAFHTPFGGMVKGAHRSMMRKWYKTKPPEIEADFQQRVMPGLNYGIRIGNSMASGIFVSLASTIDHAALTTPQRIGCFSYGSGCCSEFYSGVVTAQSKTALQTMGIDTALSNRYRLSMNEYDELLKSANQVKFGTRDKVIADGFNHALNDPTGTSRLVLKEIKNFERIYQWT